MMRNWTALALVAFGSVLPCKGRAANLRSTNRDLAEDWAAALDCAHGPDDIPKHRHHRVEALMRIDSPLEEQG